MSHIPSAKVARHRQAEPEITPQRRSDEPVTPQPEFDSGDSGEAFQLAEIDKNRRNERVLVPKALFALSVVAILATTGEIFFR